LKATGSIQYPIWSSPKQVPATKCTKKELTATRTRKKNKQQYNKSRPKPIAKKRFPANSNKSIIDHVRPYKMATKMSRPTHLLKTRTRPNLAK